MEADPLLILGDVSVVGHVVVIVYTIVVAFANVNMGVSAAVHI